MLGEAVAESMKKAQAAPLVSVKNGKSTLVPARNGKEAATTLSDVAHASIEAAVLALPVDADKPAVVDLPVADDDDEDDWEPLAGDDSVLSQHEEKFTSDAIETIPYTAEPLPTGAVIGLAAKTQEQKSTQAAPKDGELTSDADDEFHDGEGREDEMSIESVMNYLEQVLDDEDLKKHEKPDS